MSKYVPASQQTSAIPWRSIDRLLAGDDSRVFPRDNIGFSFSPSFGFFFVRSEDNLSIWGGKGEELIAIVYSSKRSWP